MLGQALLQEGSLWHEIHAPSRSEVNLLEDIQIEMFIERINPECIINAAAMVNFTNCEENPRYAYMINARPVATIANCCRKQDIKLIQISSDQCAYPLLNEYAKTKKAAEAFALTSDTALVVRTNVVGLKNLDWAFKAIEEGVVCKLYNNYVVSSIDVWAFSEALFNFVGEPNSGIINIASCESFSKENFVRKLATVMGYSLTHAESIPLPDNANRYPDLTLDVKLAEKWLNYRLPTMNDVVNRIIKERQTL